ncbi:tRNA (guanine37-N1)-methyltransferase, partial [Tremellales sp. Uapishka_1]
MSHIASSSTAVKPNPSLRETIRPPTLHGMKELDRDAFKVTVPILAARVESSNLGKLRRNPLLSGQILDLKVKSIVEDKADPNFKLLRLRVSSEDQLPEPTRELLRSEAGGLLPDSIDLGYDNWNATEVLNAILPIDHDEETPSSFTLTGHIGHINLRDEWLPYKHLIGQVILDKNKNLRTVVNKLNNIHAQYRYFDMEVLAGDKDYITTTNESTCSFTFDFSLVYWNSRLHHEHERLVGLFQPGQVVADVMAGVGPFAIPAAKKGCYVLGNDLNPESVKWMRVNRVQNHVESTLRVTEIDGRQFIREAAADLYTQPFRPSVPRAELKRREKEARRARADPSLPQPKPKPTETEIETERRPQLIDHFVMNLPDSALEFLDAYQGCYTPLLDIEGFVGEAACPLPMVHVHCFTRELEEEKATLEICAVCSPISTADKLILTRRQYPEGIRFPRSRAQTDRHGLPPTLRPLRGP